MNSVRKKEEGRRKKEEMGYTLGDLLKQPFSSKIFDIIIMKTAARYYNSDTLNYLKGRLIAMKITDLPCLRFWVDPRFHVSDTSPNYHSEFRLCATLQQNYTNVQYGIIFPVPQQTRELVWIIHVVEIIEASRDIHIADFLVDSVSAEFTKKTLHKEIITSKNPLSSLDDQGYLSKT